MKKKYLALFVLIFNICQLLNAQNFPKLLEKKKYEKIISKCNNNLEKDPNDIESLYYSAVVKSRFDADKFLLPLEAYTQFTQALSNFRELTDAKTIKNLEEIPINEISLQMLADSIYSQGLRLATIENTEESYENFISNFPLASNKYKLEAIKERNRISYESAVVQNSIESFKLFINKYPNAVQLNDAWKHIYRIAYNEAIKINSISSFNEFIKKYPKADQITDAWENIYRLGFSEAENINSISSYQKYTLNYPKSQQAKLAEQRIHKLAYEVAIKDSSIASLEDFLLRYPNSIQNNDARALLHKLAFTKAESENNSESYKLFLEKYPNSTFTKEAEKKFKLKEFEENTTIGDWESYRSFYENFESPLIYSAIDSIASIANDGNVKAFKYLVDNNLLEDKLTSLAKSLLNNLIKNGEYAELLNFNENFNSILSDEVREKLDREIIISRQALDLKLDEPFNPKFREKYINYIKKAGRGDLGFVALQRIISGELKTKRYGEALKTIESLEKYFSENKNRIENLKNILKSKIDLTISPLALKEINTLSNEYSPVISADNLNLFFCNKNTTSDESNEHLFVSKFDGKRWDIPTEIELSSETGLNNAPLANSSDGNNLFVFSEGDIYETYKTSTGWEELQPMNSNINTSNWEGDLTISSDNNTIIFSRGNPPLEKNIDIVFLVDATGSMGPCINGVKDNIYNFIDGLKNNGETVNWRAKIIHYRDVELPGEVSYFSNDFTNDQEILNEQLNFNASGGGDEPESTLESIYKTIKETKWSDNKNTSRVLITFTDATNKARISNESYLKYGPIDSETVSNQLNKENIKFFLFAQNDYQYKLLENENTEINLYDYAVRELQNADYSVIMNDLSEKVSLLSSNTKVFHGDRLPLSDLYISHKDKNGQWGKSTKLPNIINTSYTERSPFLHPDLKTLYFSSDGHGGLGKLDVFVSKRLSDTCWDCWSEPINLGKEINSPNSDWGYKISTDGETAYFSKSNNLKSKEDLFKITLPPLLRPELVAKIEGKILNDVNLPVSTTIRWEDLKTNKEIGIAKTDPSNGKYFIVLPLGKNYGYFIEDPEYFPVSQNLDLSAATSAVTVNMDIKVTSIKKMLEESIAVSMNNIFFENGKYDLLPTSVQELKRVAKLIKNFNVKVEISGHTDDVGDDIDNQILSDKRANSVNQFLVANGCNHNLLKSIGYGEKKPIVSNDSAQNRAKNRRVELKFIK